MKSDNTYTEAHAMAGMVSTLVMALSGALLVMMAVCAS